MSPVLTVSLLDPVFWGIGSAAVWCGYRLSKWSWVRLLLGIVCFPGMIGVVALQSHLLHVLQPTGFDPKMIDYALFPDIIGGLSFMMYIAIREDGKRKQQEGSDRQ